METENTIYALEYFDEVKISDYFVRRNIAKYEKIEPEIREDRYRLENYKSNGGIPDEIFNRKMRENYSIDKDKIEIAIRKSEEFILSKFQKDIIYRIRHEQEFKAEQKRLFAEAIKETLKERKRLKEEKKKKEENEFEKRWAKFERKIEKQKREKIKKRKKAVPAFMK